MKITQEHIFGHEDDASGYDIRFEASELAIPPGPPLQEVTLTMLDGSPVRFTLCGEAVDGNHQHLYWSYWNDSSDTSQAVNLQIFND